MQIHFTGLSQSLLDPACSLHWAMTKNLEIAEFGGKSSLYKQPFHSRSYLLNLILEHSIARVSFCARIVLCSKVISKI